MTPDANTPTASTTLTGWLARRRAEVAYGLLALGVLFLGLAIYFGYQSFGSDSAPADKKDDKGKEKSELFEPKDKEKDKSAVRLDRDDYFAPTLWAGIIGLVALSLGGWQLNRDEQPEEEPRRARTVVLVLGGIAGLATAILGLALAYQWRNSLLDWLTKDQIKEARWILLALVIYFVGLTMIFFSLQPARTEERTSPLLRRLVYGFNSVLTGLLLFLVLAVGNVVAGMKLPTILDTTESRLFSLDDRSRAFLRELRQPVHAYMILGAQDDIYQDLRAMMANAQDVSPNFKFSHMS